MKELTRKEFLQYTGKAALAIGALVTLGKLARPDNPTGPVSMSFRITAKPKGREPHGV